MIHLLNTNPCRNHMHAELMISPMFSRCTLMMLLVILIIHCSAFLSCHVIVRIISSTEIGIDIYRLSVISIPMNLKLFSCSSSAQLMQTRVLSVCYHFSFVLHSKHLRIHNMLNYCTITFSNYESLQRDTMLNGITLLKKMHSEGYFSQITPCPPISFFDKIISNEIYYGKFILNLLL